MLYRAGPTCRDREQCRKPAQQRRRQTRHGCIRYFPGQAPGTPEWKRLFCFSDITSALSLTQQTTPWKIEVISGFSEKNDVVTGLSAVSYTRRKQSIKHSYGKLTVFMFCIAAIVLFKLFDAIVSYRDGRCRSHQLTAELQQKSRSWCRHSAWRLTKWLTTTPFHWQLSFPLSLATSSTHMTTCAMTWRHDDTTTYICRLVRL